MQNIAQLIREYITTNKISQREFARRMGVSPAAVSYWINERTSMSVYSYLRFCELQNKEDKESNV